MGLALGAQQRRKRCPALTTQVKSIESFPHKHTQAHQHTTVMAAAEQPGAAFLRRRLARAQAVPPAERSPEVQAFITSVELGRQGCDLLPLRQSSRGGGEARAALPLGDPTTTLRCSKVVWSWCSSKIIPCALLSAV